MKVSIIIPVYNAEKRVGKCLDSILPQMNDETELLLIDDGSRDGSAEVLKQYRDKHKDKQIRVICQENRGAARTRNRGIREASGDWIAFVDNDDFTDENYLDSLLGGIGNAGELPDIVLGGYRRVSDTKEQFHVDAVSNPWYPFTVTAPWARLYRRQFLLENRLEFLSYPMGEDVCFNLACYAAADRIKIIPYTGYNWYYNEESVSNTVQKGFSDRIVFTELLDYLYEACGIPSLPKKKRQYFYWFFVRYVIWYLLFSGRTAKADAFVCQYRESFAWLRKKKIPIRFPVLKRIFSCERTSVRIAVGVFLLVHRLHLAGLFARVYAKG